MNQALPWAVAGSGLTGRKPRAAIVAVLAYLALALSGPVAWWVLLTISDALELWTKKGKVIIARERTTHDCLGRETDGTGIR